MLRKMYVKNIKYITQYDLLQSTELKEKVPVCVKWY